MGIFGIGEIIANLEHQSSRDVMLKTITGCFRPARIGTASGRRSCAGPRWAPFSASLPGGGAMLASFGAYSLEKKMSKNPERVRQGRDRGRRGAGGRQQRRRADLVHPDADTRHPIEPGHGTDDRRHDHPGNPARPIGDDGTADAVLGPDRFDVDRQPVPARPESAADRAVGEDDRGPLPPALSGDHRLLRRSASSRSTTPVSTSS